MDRKLVQDSSADSQEIFSKSSKVNTIRALRNPARTLRMSHDHLYFVNGVDFPIIQAAMNANSLFSILILRELKFHSLKTQFGAVANIFARASRPMFLNC